MSRSRTNGHRRINRIFSMILTLALLVTSIQLPSAAVKAEEGTKTFNVLDYGANPAGVADSAPAVWAAIADAKAYQEANPDAKIIINFPEGRYDFYPDRIESRVLYVSNTLQNGQNNSNQGDWDGDNPDTSSTFKNKYIGVLIEGMKNVTVEGNNSLFMYHGNMTTFASLESENVKFQNFTTDFQTPWSVDTTIVSVDREKNQAVVKIPESYTYTVSGGNIRLSSEVSPYNGRPYWSNRDPLGGGQMKVLDIADNRWTGVSGNHTYMTNKQSIVDNGDHTVTITYSTMPNIRAGLAFQTRDTWRRTPVNFLWKSKDVVVSNIQYNYCHGFGIVAQHTENIEFKDLTFGPNKETGRTSGGFADFMQISGCAGVITVDGCLYLNPQDDPINMHGTYNAVESISSNRKEVTVKFTHSETFGFPNFFIGDELEFTNGSAVPYNTSGSLSTADTGIFKTKVLEYEGPDGRGRKVRITKGADGQLNTEVINADITLNENELRLMKLKLETAIPAGVPSGNGTRVENITKIPSKIEIMNSTFKESGPRGILLKARGEIDVHDNLFDGLAQYAIQVENPAASWMESGRILNMHIYDNIFTRGRGEKNSYITIEANGGTAGLHKNITIDNNTFYMGYYGDTNQEGGLNQIVTATSVENLAIKNNVVRWLDNNINLTFKDGTERAADVDVQKALAVNETDTITKNGNAANGISLDVKGKTLNSNFISTSNCSNVDTSNNFFEDGLKNIAVGSNIEYISSNPEVLTVDANGRVEAKQDGVAKVTAYAVMKAPEGNTTAVDLRYASTNSIVYVVGDAVYNPDVEVEEGTVVLGGLGKGLEYGPNADASKIIANEDGSLDLTAIRGNVYTTTNTMQSLVAIPFANLDPVVDPVNDDWKVEVEVTGTSRQNWEMAGLMVYKDFNNYALVQRQRRGNANTVWISRVGEKNQSASENYDVMANTSVEKLVLILEKEGSKVVGKYKLGDETEERLISGSEYTLTDVLDANAKIGIFAGGNDNTDHLYNFKNLKVTKTTAPEVEEVEAQPKEYTVASHFEGSEAGKARMTAKEDGSLDIAVSTGQVYQENNTMQNIISVPFSAEGDWRAEVVLNGVTERNYQIGGLIVYNDYDNFVLLQRQQRGDANTVWISRVGETGGRANETYKVMDEPRSDAPMTLILEKSGDTIVAKYSVGGNEQQIEGSEYTSPISGDAKIGIFAGGNEESDTVFNFSNLQAGGNSIALVQEVATEEETVVENPAIVIDIPLVGELTEVEVVEDSNDVVLSNAYLKNVAIKVAGEDVTANLATGTTSGFAKKAYAYTYRVADPAITDLAFEFEPEDSNASVEVYFLKEELKDEKITKSENGVYSGNVSLVNAANQLEVKVTAADGVTYRMYRFLIDRKGYADAKLTKLKVHNTTLISGTASKNTFDMKVDGTSEVSVVAETNSPKAKVRIATDGSKFADGKVKLHEGNNKLVVSVTPENGGVPTAYEVNILCSVPGSTGLSSISLTNARLDQTVARGIKNYTATATSGKTKLTVKTLDAAAKIAVEYDGKTVEGVGTVVSTLALKAPTAEEKNIATITVTSSQDESKSETYKLDVTFQDFVYLSDVNWTATRNAYSSTPKLDQSWEGKMGVVNKGTVPSAGVTYYDKGVFMHPNGTARWAEADYDLDALGGGFSRFTAVIGIAASANKTDQTPTVEFHVLLDGQEIDINGSAAGNNYTASIQSNGTSTGPKELDIDISKAHKLTIGVTRRDNNNSVHGAWADAKLYKSADVEVEEKEETSDLTMWYKAPAGNQDITATSYKTSTNDEYNTWQRYSLPIGNGKIGANIFGRTKVERVMLTEETFWSGGPKPSVKSNANDAKSSQNPRAFGNLVDKGQNGQLMATIKDKYAKGEDASTLAGNGDNNGLVGPKDGDGNQGYGFQLAYANMFLEFGHDNYSKYSRDLDLSTAVSHVDYVYNNTNFHRDYFMNNPSNVFVTRLTAKEGNEKLNFTLRMKPDPETTASVGHSNGSGKQRNYSVTVNGKSEELAGSIDIKGTLNDNELKFASKTVVLIQDETGKCEVLNNSNQVVNSYSKQGITNDEGGNLKITNATDVVIITSIATNYEMTYPDYRKVNASGQFETENDVFNRVSADVLAAASKGYEGLYDEHKDDYQNLFNRLDLNFGGSTNKSTDDLLTAYKNNRATAEEKNHLEVLLYQYGRYMSIASSRANSQLPNNLQGIWVAGNNSPWHTDFHLNVNEQMNYWPVYASNLAENAKPLINFVDKLREPGRVTARVYAGISSEANVKRIDATGSALANYEDTPWNDLEVTSPTKEGYRPIGNGFMAHTQNTPFGWTTPGWNFKWGWSPAAIPWILQNCWEYYEYTKDYEYMKNYIFPMMWEECRLYVQMLDKRLDPKYPDGYYYISTPAYSPEHGPITDGNTYEQTLIWQLFMDSITAGKEIISKETTLRGQFYGDASIALLTEEIAKWEEVLEHLYGPVEIGKSGQIKEWFIEEAYAKNAAGNNLGDGYNQRHLSHMLGLYPGDYINVEKPDLFKAAEWSMKNRTDDSQGWSIGQRIVTWARLRNGEKSHDIMSTYLFGKKLFPNLWDWHGQMGGLQDSAVFQIDGNFGYTAAVNEMLMQSNLGYIDLLPALPRQWSDGSVEGLVARGNFVLDMSWSDGRLSKVQVTSKAGGDCTIQFLGAEDAQVEGVSEDRITRNGDKITIKNTSANEVFTVNNF